MVHVADGYIHELAQATKKLPLWYPTTDIKLGDIGVIEDGAWITVSSLRRKGVPFETYEDTTPDDQLTLGGGDFFRAHVGVNGEIAPMNLPVGEAKASLGVGFNSAGQFYLQALGLTVHKIAYLDEVEEAVLDLARERDEWKPNWMFVSEAAVAERTLLAIASEAGASFALDLGLSVNNPVLHLGEASGDAKISAENKMAITSLSLKPRVLTYGARRVVKGWFWDKDVAGVGIFALGAAMGALRLNTFSRYSTARPDEVPAIDDVTLADIGWER